jgi:peptidyl-prolyl cis-trans isomerase C
MIKSLVPVLLAAALPAWGAAPDQPKSTNAAAPAKPASKVDDLFNNTVVAKGKGVEVTRALLDDEVIRLKAQMAGRGQTLPPEQAALIDRQVLDQLIQIQLMKAKATDADKAAGKEQAEKRFEEAKTRMGSEEALTRQLKLMDTTREEVLSKWADSSTAEVVLKRELKVTVTDDDVKKFYEDNPARFEQPEMVRASHILLSTMDPATKTPIADDKKLAKRKVAEEVLKRARAGEDFAKLAKEFSEDPGSRENGGEYKFSRGQMVPEFENTAFSLAINQVSDIVTTQFGYHIIKLSEKIPARKLTLDETIEGVKVSDQVKEMLKRQQLEKLLPGYVEKLRQEAKVEILDEKLKQAGELIEANRPRSGAESKPLDKKSDAKK